MYYGEEVQWPHDCKIKYNASGGDALRNKDGYSKECVRHNEQMKADPDSHLHATPKRTPAKTRDLSCVVFPTSLPDEQERKRKNPCKVRTELKIDLLSETEPIRHEFLSLLARGLDDLAVTDDDYGIRR